ncbi:MAG: hypothetical protein ACLS85_13330 [Coprobacillus cateniformis]
MGNINRPKLDSEDIELRENWKTQFCRYDLYINFTRPNAKKRRLKEGLYSLLNITL